MQKGVVTLSPQSEVFWNYVYFQSSAAYSAIPCRILIACTIKDARISWTHASVLHVYPVVPYHLFIRRPKFPRGLFRWNMRSIIFMDYIWIIYISSISILGKNRGKALKLFCFFLALFKGEGAAYAHSLPFGCDMARYHTTAYDLAVVNPSPLRVLL